MRSMRSLLTEAETPASPPSQPPHAPAALNENEHQEEEVVTHDEPTFNDQNASRLQELQVSGFPRTGTFAHVSEMADITFRRRSRESKLKFPRKGSKRISNLTWKLTER